MLSAALFLWQRNVAQYAERGDETEQPTRVPDLAFVDLDSSKPGNLTDYRGKILLVNFWASWCAPCRKEMPALMQISREYESKGVGVLGVAMDVGGFDGVRRFLQDVEVTYPIVIPKGRASSLGSVRVLPTTWLIDTEGRVALVYAGAMKEEMFRQGVERLLAEASRVTR